MNRQTFIYHWRHFPGEIIAQAVYLYHKFTLSLRDVEELLAMRGISVSYEIIRVWCAHFGPTYAKRLRYRSGRACNTIAVQFEVLSDGCAVTSAQ